MTFLPLVPLRRCCFIATFVHHDRWSITPGPLPFFMTLLVLLLLMPIKRHQRRVDIQIRIQRLQ